MSETTNIAQMAKKVSSEIFVEFGWTQQGGQDLDWDCVTQEKHEVKTHPSDVVFWYDDPYANEKVFLNTDLKSYAVGTLKKPQVRGALTSLCKSVDCANVANGWRSLYGDDNVNYRCHGLLFVYNHDGEYEGDFEKLFEGMETKDIPLDGPNRVFVFSPKTVSYLATIAQNIKACRGDRLLPLAKKDYSFYYPDLIGARPKFQNQNAASIEVLLSPWQIIRYIKAAEDGGRQKVNYIVYYRGQGTSVDEFKYLFDALFRFGLLGDEECVSLRMPFADTNAHAFFSRAKDAYAADFYDLKEFRARLNRVAFDQITTIVKQFSATNLGMTNV